MFYLIIIWPISFFSKKLVFTPTPFSLSPFLFPFPFFLYFSLSSPSLPHAGASTTTYRREANSRDRAPRDATPPWHPSPLPPPPWTAVHPAPLLSHLFPPRRAHHGRPSSSQVRPWLPFMESSNQGHFSLGDNQNGCVRPSSCYPHAQFYLKLTLISGFYRILFFI
jgi:hypothetical protein